MKTQMIDALKTRRSRYQLEKTSPISDNEIEYILKESLRLTPSAFNSQSGRLVLLLGEKHDALWDITTNELKRIVPEAKFGSTQKKMNQFKAAYATILFFEDQAVIEQLQTDFSLYKDVFPVWSNQSAGMLQLSVWTGLAENGLGASLQHYNPVIDDAVKEYFNIPTTWKLMAQMPFGVFKGIDEVKDSIAIEKRFRVIK